MTVQKNWLIIVFLIAIVFYFWLGDEESSESEFTRDHSATDQPSYREGSPSRSTWAPPGRQVPDWNLDKSYKVPAWPQDGFSYGNFPTLENGGIRAPELGGYRFSTQDGKPKSLMNWQSSSAYPTWQGYSDAPATPGFQHFEMPYDAQKPRGYGYRFRPHDSRGRSGRWTGNYPQLPGIYPDARMRPSAPQTSGQYPSPWQ